MNTGIMQEIDEKQKELTRYEKKLNSGLSFYKNLIDWKVSEIEELRAKIVDNRVNIIDSVL